MIFALLALLGVGVYLERFDLSEGLAWAVLAGVVCFFSLRLWGPLVAFHGIPAAASFVLAFYLGIAQVGVNVPGRWPWDGS